MRNPGTSTTTRAGRLELILGLTFVILSFLSEGLLALKSELNPRNILRPVKYPALAIGSIIVLFLTRALVNRQDWLLITVAWTVPLLAFSVFVISRKKNLVKPLTTILAWFAITWGGIVSGQLQRLTLDVASLPLEGPVIVVAILLGIMVALTLYMIDYSRDFPELLKKAASKAPDTGGVQNQIRTWLSRYQKRAKDFWMTHNKVIRAFFASRVFLIMSLLIAAAAFPPVSIAELSGNASSAPLNIQFAPDYYPVNFRVSEARLTLDTLSNTAFIQVMWSGQTTPGQFYVSVPFEPKNVRLFPTTQGNVSQPRKSAEGHSWLISVRDYSYQMGLGFEFPDIMARSLWKSTLSLTLGTTRPIPEIPTNASWRVFLNAERVVVIVSFPRNQVLDSDTFPSPSSWSLSLDRKVALWTLEISDLYPSIQLSLITHSVAWGLPLPAEIQVFIIPLFSLVLGYHVRASLSKRKSET